MSRTASRSAPFCGCTGCRNEAEVVIDHPIHGEMVVCRPDSHGYEVVGYV